MFNPNPLPDFRRRNDRNRQNGSCQNPQNRTPVQRFLDFASGQNPFFLLSLALTLLGVLIQVMPFLLGSVYTTVTSLALVIWTSLDFAFGARLFAEVPAIMWTVWGAILGACGAFWLSAPLYGWRSKRALLFAVPIALMLATGLAISLNRPVPTQPQLIVPPQPTTPTTPNATITNNATNTNQALPR